MRPFDSSLPDSIFPSPSTGGNLPALETFMDNLFHPQVDRSFIIQLYVCASLVIVVSLIGAAIVSLRLYEGRAWFIKLYHTPDGVFVIPNAALAFAQVEGIFGIIWTAYAFVSAAFYQTGAHETNYFLWRTLIWYPLWLGAWYTAWGTLSAFPDALRVRGHNQMQRHLMSPLTFNAVCWAFPLLQLGSIVAPAVLADTKYNSQLRNYHAWLGSAMAASPNPDAETFMNLADEGHAIWLEVTRAYWLYAVCMTVWVIWACIIMLVYVPIGAHTLARVRSQIKLAERKTRSEDTFYLFHPPLQRSGSNDGTPAFSSPAARNVPRWSADTRVDPPGSPALDKTNRPKALSDASLRPASQKHSGDAGAVSSVFPPVNRAAEEAETQHMPAARRRVFNLKRIFNNVSVQYVSVSIAIASFIASASILAAQTYEDSRRNEIGPSQVSANLLAAYVTVLFGTLSLGSIFRRSFDPALTIEQDEDDRPSARRLRSKLAAFRNLREPEKSNFLQMDELSMPSHQTASGSGPDAVASGGSERVKTTTVVNEGRKSRTTSLSQSSPTRAPVGRPPSPPAQPAQAAQPAQPVFYPTPFGRIAGSSAAVPSSTAVSPQQTDVTFAEPLVIRRRQEVYAAQFAQASPSAHGAWRRASVGVASPNRGGGGNGAVSAQRPDQAVRSQADVPSSHESLVRTNSGASGDDVVDADMIKVASPKAAAIKRSRSHLEHSHSRKRSEEDASGAGGSRHRLTKNFALHLRDDDISRMKDQETFFV